MNYRDWPWSDPRLERYVELMSKVIHDCPFPCHPTKKSIQIFKNIEAWQEWYDKEGYIPREEWINKAEKYYTDLWQSTIDQVTSEGDPFLHENIIKRFMEKE